MNGKNVSFNFRMTIPVKICSLDYEKILKEEFARHLGDFVKINFDTLPIDRESYIDQLNFTKDVYLRCEFVSTEELRRLKEIETLYNNKVFYNNKAPFQL